MRFKIYTDIAGFWRWQLLAANNWCIADSGQGYKRKRDCIKAAEKIVEGASRAVVMVEKD